MSNNPGPLETTLAGMIENEAGIFAISVRELPSGGRWTINPDLMRSASLIKIFIMVEAFHQSNQNRLDLDEKKIITDALKVGGAGSLQNSPDGTEVTWRELIELMIAESDNTATNILIDRLTMEKINGKISELGCGDTILRRKMMDFAAARQGHENMTSVADVTAVLEKIYFGRCLNPGLDNTMLSILKRQKDKCKIPVLLPKEVIVAHKTGELKGLEHDAGIVYGPCSHYIIAVMSDSLPDGSRGKEIISRLSRTVYDFLNTMEQKNPTI